MIGAAEMFTLFFVMLGPLRLLGPFMERTRGIDDAMARQVAWWAFVIATVSVIAGGLLGASLLARWQVSIPAMTLTGGIVFFLVAIKQLLQQYERPRYEDPEPLPSLPFAAASRLVFPTVLTPYGVAAVITLLARTGELETRTMILLLVLIVMVLDLVAMWFARRILVGYAIIVLQVLAAVLAVMQVALSIQFILAGLQSLGVIAA